MILGMQEEKQIGCLALRCLGLLGGAWRAFVWFSRIIGFQMPAETSLMKKKKRKKRKKETSLMLASPSTVVVVGRLDIIHGICALVEILSLSKNNSILSFLPFSQNHNSPCPKPQNASLSWFYIITGVMVLPKILPEVLWGLQCAYSPQVTSVVVWPKGAKYHTHEISVCALVSPRCLPLVYFSVPPWLPMDMPKPFPIGNPPFVLSV